MLSIDSIDKIRYRHAKAPLPVPVAQGRAVLNEARELAGVSICSTTEPSF